MEPLTIGTALAVFQPSWEMGFHQHAEFEISAILEGKGEFEWAGGIYSLERGHVVMIPPHVMHTYRSTTPIRFAVLAASGVTKEVQQMVYRITSANCPRVLFLSDLDMAIYESLFRNWLKTVSRSLNDRDQYINTWIELLILLLMQDGSGKDNSVPIVNAADYIRSELHQDLRISDLSAMFGFSVSNFRKVFTASYKMSPKQYQQHCRLHEAKWLLRSSEKPIRLIAEQVGFSTLHAFSAWFQKYVGIPPTRWRSMQRGTYSDLSNN